LIKVLTLKVLTFKVTRDKKYLYSGCGGFEGLVKNFVRDIRW